jgi:hypothetical protein
MNDEHFQTAVAVPSFNIDSAISHISIEIDVATETLNIIKQINDDVFGFENNEKTSEGDKSPPAPNALDRLKVSCETLHDVNRELSCQVHRYIKIITPDGLVGSSCTIGGALNAASKEVRGTP